MTFSQKVISEKLYPLDARTGFNYQRGKRKVVSDMGGGGEYGGTQEIFWDP